MSNREFFAQTLKNEIPIFVRVINAVIDVPAANLTYAPDPKSRNAFDMVAQTLGMEGKSFPQFLKTGKVDFGNLMHTTVYASVAEVLTDFQKVMNETTEIISNMSDEDWDSEAVMVMGENEGWKTTKGGMAWGLLFDLIHHRGQIATYIRPMGGKVPAIYGPSADSQN